MACTRGNRLRTLACMCAQRTMLHLGVACHAMTFGVVQTLQRLEESLFSRYCAFDCRVPQKPTASAPFLVSGVLTQGTQQNNSHAIRGAMQVIIY